MDLPPFEQAVARICAQNRRYAPEAYLFLHAGLMRTLKQTEEREKRRGTSPVRNWQTDCANTHWPNSARWP